MYYENQTYCEVDERTMVRLYLHCLILESHSSVAQVETEETARRPRPVYLLEAEKEPTGKSRYVVRRCSVWPQLLQSWTKGFFPSFVWMKFK